MPNLKHKVILAIMDGWGIAPDDKYNAINNASTPNVDMLIREYPNTSLKSDSEAVGLPPQTAGTSEVNHLVIGSGRVMQQPLHRINEEVANGKFGKNRVLIAAVEHALEHKSNINLIGIISAGGVHNHVDHLIATVEMCKNLGVEKNVYIHAFTDGRDSPPYNAEKELKYLQKHLDRIGLGKVATLQGRFWLDRARDWEKTETAFKLVHEGVGIEVDDWDAAIKYGYQNHETSEYFDQYIIDKDGLIGENDTVIFTHFRSDRLYQLTKRILDEKIRNLKFVTFGEVSEGFDAEVAFQLEAVDHTLAEVLAQHKRRQLHITETEKFTHLTYFLNGRNEVQLWGEDWVLMESNRFIKPQYNFEPSMRAFDVTAKVLESIEQNKYDFYAINFASTDMVGHTGNYNAAVISAESIDFCIGKIYEAVKDKLDEYTLIVTADHGNSEEMWDYENNQPHTRHTINKVPFIIVTNRPYKLKRNDTISGIAPTILEIMDVPQPHQMTAASLLDS